MDDHVPAPSHPGILSYFTRHGTAANLLLVVLVVAGLFAFPRMRAQYFPDVVLDSITVSVTWDGAGAEDVDAAVVELLEPALLAVDGVESSESIAREGRASIELEFEPGYDMGRAADDVQQAVDAITNLPEDVDEPTVRRDAWRDRVSDVVISGPVSVDLLARFTDEFVARLYAEGVTRTTIRGVAAPQVVVEVPTLSLVRHNVTMSEIADAIAGEVDAAPAGDVTGANARVRTGSEKRSAEEIAEITLRSNRDGTRLTIGDVAQIRVEGVNRNRSYFVGNDPAVSLRVDRSAQGDAIEIQEIVERVAAETLEGLPEGVTIDLIRTRSEQISSRLNVLFENAILGLGLVVVLLFLFLNARTALWVAAGIPVAMLMALFFMWVGGLTLNMMSLFALLLTLGIIVDDAIVVGEHADFRVRRMGEHPVAAAENAARRMTSPVFAASLTTVIAFAGLMAIGGRFGNMIADIPLTVIVVLMASLVECFLILPNHLAHSLHASSKKEAWFDWPSRTMNRGFVWFRHTVFRRLMALVIWARYPVLAGLLLLLSAQVVLLVRGDMQWRFFSAPEEGSVSGNFAMAPGATREDSLEQMRAFQVAVEALGAEYEATYGTNPVTYALAEIGGNTGRGLAGTEGKDEDQLGSIAVELIDPDLRPYSSAVFVSDLQDRVERHPLVETISFRGWYSGPGGDALDVQFYGASPAILKSAAEKLKQEVTQFSEVSAVEDDLAYDKEELILDLTPQGEALGFTVDDLGRVMRNRLNGIEAATYPLGPRSAEIRVELPESELTADFLSRTELRTPDGQYVPLADIVEVSRRDGFSTIRRENGIRVVSVMGDIADDDPARAQEIVEALRTDILPRIERDFGVSHRLSGLAEQERDFLNDAMVGFGLCLMGIYLTLAWVFSSWTRPLLIMAVIPFGLIGTIYGHSAWQLPLSMFTVVGLIGMSGIIINDSIVLVTTVDDYERERGLIPAIIDAAADRLRPVLLTTMTTVIGLAPLLYEPSRQAQFLKPTVITLVYGLGFGVLLVLLIVPSLLAVQRDVARQVAATRRAVRQPGRARAVSWPTLAATVAVAVLFVATMGHALVAGAIWPPLGAALGMGAAGIGGALALFVLGAVAITFAAFVIGALVLALTGRRKFAAETRTGAAQP
ncbi:efflux RND transporter permease subunit [Tropicimonas isoalkanivorans]|uniref:Multidrug efflux pump subunit AcrB n=1 Tax=Tropicimonas isoalkanivorans TaxID=441112 RepID=A0A1I1N626_9RHOB|nr:efflux RND transporter permease subunit [Tropicimonas isoalkanivorans]SFC92905.1 Multidrug efflux pump subunit AcrB [Tropicimonas isoalkanivorans]